MQDKGLSLEVAFRLVDVFAEQPFAGNQLCVVTDPPPELDGETMQILAREIAFSETTFVLETSPAGYRMRIFTPDEELPFAGHPTIGTALTLAADGRIGAEAIQTTSVGEIPVWVDLDRGFAWMRQHSPEFGEPFDDRDLVARAAGLDPSDLRDDVPTHVVSTGLPALMVPVRDEATLRRASRDGRACAEIRSRTGGELVYLFAVRGDGDVMARMFDSGHGISEDPATGSAGGALGAYLTANHLAGMPGSVVIAQGEMVNRPSFIHVEVTRNDEEWSVRVGGGVRLVGEGVFRI